jgi:hypothetical protein
VVYCRLSEKEYDSLGQIMVSDNLRTASDTLRLGLREAAKRRGLWPVDGECPPTDQEAA